MKWGWVKMLITFLTEPSIGERSVDIVVKLRFTFRSCKAFFYLRKNIDFYNFYDIM